MGYADRAGASGVERFMKHYYIVAKDVGDLTRIFCAAIEAENMSRPIIRLPRLRRPRDLMGFTTDRDRLTVADDEQFERDPVAMIRLFYVAHNEGLDIHPHALRLVTQNLKRIDKDVREDPEANRMFVEMASSIDSPEQALTRMNEAGVFGRFLRDFGRVVGQTQHDMYHVYTVDEHTIQAIGLLAKIERGELVDDHPVASEVIHKIGSRRALYMGVLFHDIAKGRGGDHSVLGARVAKRVCPRIGLDAEENHHGLRRPGPVARAPAPSVVPDGRRYARDRAERLEQLEGRVAARAVSRGRRCDVGRATHERAGRSD